MSHSIIKVGDFVTIKADTPQKPYKVLKIYKVADMKYADVKDMVRLEYKSVPLAKLVLA